MFGTLKEFRKVYFGILDEYSPIMESGCLATSRECGHSVLDSSLCSNVGPLFLHVINVCAVVSFYALILVKMITTRYQHPDKSTHGDQLKSISKTLILLTGAYMAFLLPPIFHFKSKIVRAVIASWYVILNH